MTEAPAPVPTPAAAPTKATTGTEVPTTPPAAAKAPPKTPEVVAKGQPPPKAESRAEDSFEIVVDGEKHTLTREQAVRQLQKEAAADKRFREAQEQTKKFQRVLELAKENPDELLRYLQLDPKAYAEKVMSRQAEEALLDPKERQLRDLQRENEGFKQKHSEFEKQQQAQQQDAHDKQVFAKIEKSFIAAAEAGGMEGTPDNLIRMIEVASEAVDLGIPLTEQQIVAEVKEREDKSFAALEKRVLGGLKGEQLAKRLGPTVVEEILRWSVEKIRGASPYKAAEQETAPQKVNGSATKYISDAEFRRRNGF